MTIVNAIAVVDRCHDHPRAASAACSTCGLREVRIVDVDALRSLVAGTEG